MMVDRMLLRKVWTLCALLCGLLAGAAQAEDAALARKLDALLLRLGPHATRAVRVVSLDRGEVLYERNPDLSLTPASNMKLFTSAAALAKLGPDYRFSTRVLTAGTRSGDTLTGDLILQGGGDPVLETAGLENLADGVKASGIRTVTGSLRADDFRFDAERLGYGWNSDDEPFYYSAQISALSVNRNVLKLDVLPGKAPGDPVTVQVQPLPEYMQVTVTAKTAARGAPEALRITRARGKNEIRVAGSTGVDAEPVRDRSVTMEEPELFAAALFRKLLADRGIRITGSIARSPAPPGATAIAEHRSLPLSEIVALLNKPSDNLVAEMLLKELGYVVRKSGDAENGTEVVEAWLRELGIGTGGVRVNDGSGLSRLNLITARALSDLLVKSEAQPWREVFRASLPVAGVDGTLRLRMQGTPAEKNVRAKTGSLSHVTSLGGYLTSAGGERLAFSVLINNYPNPVSGPQGAKIVEDALAVALVEYQRAAPVPQGN